MAPRSPGSRWRPSSSRPERGAAALPDFSVIWDRWNALGPDQRAKGFIEANGELVALYESLSDDQLRNLRIDLGFMPEPVDIATLASMRLSEQTLHGWDVFVAFDPAAALMAEAVPHLLDRSGAVIGWFGKAGMLEQRPAAIVVRTTEPDRTFGLYVDDEVSLGEAPEQPVATLDLPGESWLRLLAGRLGVGRTPADVTMSAPSRSTTCAGSSPATEPRIAGKVGSTRRSGADLSRISRRGA